jgi:hypothetical protein
MISQPVVMFLAGPMVVLLGFQPDRALVTLSQLEQVSLAGRMAISLDSQRDLALAMLNQLVLAAKSTRSASNSHRLKPRRALDCRQIQVHYTTILPSRSQPALLLFMATAIKVELLCERWLSHGIGVVRGCWR